MPWSGAATSYECVRTCEGSQGTGGGQRSGDTASWVYPVAALAVSGQAAAHACGYMGITCVSMLMRCLALNDRHRQIAMVNERTSQPSRFFMLRREASWLGQGAAGTSHRLRLDTS
jgi:hypothetical protein